MAGPVETLQAKEVRKPKVIEPTVIRLNKGLRNLDNNTKERIVLDFGSSNLVSSGMY